MHGRVAGVVVLVATIWTEAAARSNAECDAGEQPPEIQAIVDVSRDWRRSVGSGRDSLADPMPTSLVVRSTRTGARTRRIRYEDPARTVVLELNWRNRQEDPKKPAFWLPEGEASVWVWGEPEKKMSFTYDDTYFDQKFTARRGRSVFLGEALRLEVQLMNASRNGLRPDMRAVGMALTRKPGPRGGSGSAGL